MTFRPTKKRQKQWIEKHLNGGSFPDNVDDYNLETNQREDKYGYNAWKQACFDAMCWLDRNDIQDLAEAWDKCPHVNWLAWMFSHMEPSKQDLKNWYKMMKSVSCEINNFYKGDYYRTIESNSTEDVEEMIHDFGFLINRCYPNNGADKVREHIKNPWLLK